MSTIDVAQQDLYDLLGIFEKKSYNAGLCEEGSVEHIITTKCENLFKLDYNLIELDNVNGSLCPRYPSRIFIPEYEHSHNKKFTPITASCSSIFSSSRNFSSLTPTNNVVVQTTAKLAVVRENNQQKQCTIYEDLYDICRIRELITKGRYARCRQRFVVPVIMFKGKYICRSATISVMHETYGRKVVDFAYDCINGTTNHTAMNLDEENNDSIDGCSLLNNGTDLPGFSYEEAIKSDIQLLRALNITTIVDFMVEQRKIKYFMTVSSSEKADLHYENFNIISLPYPGCEFFKDFRDNNYLAENLYFNWNQSFIDATVNIPKLVSIFELGICWPEYKKWDLVLMTQNYLKVTLKYIQDCNSGLLMHCISGWDRTPLFISLVRMSLWADGLIHQSLNAMQMTFFTLAYDWYLFGHQLPDRLSRGEDIMFFCFHMLKYIADDDFSIVEHRKRTKTLSSNSTNSNCSPAATKSESCDEILLKEESLFNIDEDSNDTSSNISNCDILTDICNATTSNNITSRSPNPKRSKTSPITVPGSSSAPRQRHESTSSTGSWQLINDAGSLDSNCAKDQTSGKMPLSLRTKRLNSVRALFIQAYGKTIGLKFQEGSSVSLTTAFIGTLTDTLF